VEITKHKRTINRQKLMHDELESQLADFNSLRSKVFTRYRRLLSARSASSAFDPHGAQKVLDIDQRIFVLLRTSLDESKQVLCIQNVTARKAEIKNPLNKTARDLLTNRSHDSSIVLKPYQTLWLD
jgi:sucrose phosphorylase